MLFMALRLIGEQNCTKVESGVSRDGTRGCEISCMFHETLQLSPYSPDTRVGERVTKLASHLFALMQERRQALPNLHDISATLYKATSVSYLGRLFPFRSALKHAYAGSTPGQEQDEIYLWWRKYHLIKSLLLQYLIR